MGAGQRWTAIAALVVGLGVVSTGVAVAGISDGAYRHERHHCSGYADDADQPDRAEPGCRSAVVSVQDGTGVEGLNAGTPQTADGQPVGALSVVASPQGLDPTSGVDVYLAADDNLDVGEHDSSSVLHDGPSDGGAVVLRLEPESVQPYLDALLTGDQGYLLTNPVPLVRAGAGSCADGICESVRTHREVAYQGGDPSQHRDAADYEGQTWDPATCAGPNDTPADCGHDGIDFWHRMRPTTYVEPGVQLYEDPDPQGSPLDPYPLPALAVTSCGIYVGGGPAAQLPASPLTNSAGQLAIPTGC
jgi:hypothetical protein